MSFRSPAPTSWSSTSTPSVRARPVCRRSPATPRTTKSCSPPGWCVPRALVAALDTDSGNLFVTVSARALCPDLFIVARARVHENEEKLLRAGANRVVNPQSIGGARIAAFVLQPHVTEFLDVVMHDQSIQFRLEEVMVPEGSWVAGRTISRRPSTRPNGALVLALREEDGAFCTNPSPDTTIKPGQVLIAIGTSDELAALDRAVNEPGQADASSASNPVAASTERRLTWSSFLITAAAPSITAPEFPFCAPLTRPSLNVRCAGGASRVEHVCARRSGRLAVPLRTCDTPRTPG